MGILKTINELRKTDSYIEAIFLKGGCYRFHLFLKAIYPDSKPYMNYEKDHVVTQYKGKIYDIRGQRNDMYFPMTKEDISMAEKWSFKKNNALVVNEYPACEEPILI